MMTKQQCMEPIAVLVVGTGFSPTRLYCLQFLAISRFFPSLQWHEPLQRSKRAMPLLTRKIRPMPMPWLARALRAMPKLAQTIRAMPKLAASSPVTHPLTMWHHLCVATRRPGSSLDWRHRTLMMTSRTTWHRSQRRRKFVRTVTFRSTEVATRKAP